MKNCQGKILIGGKSTICDSELQTCPKCGDIGCMNKNCSNTAIDKDGNCLGCLRKEISS